MLVTVGGRGLVKIVAEETGDVTLEQVRAPCSARSRALRVLGGIPGTRVPMRQGSLPPLPPESAPQPIA